MSVNHMLSNFQQQIFIQTNFLQLFNISCEQHLPIFSTSVHDSVVLFLFRKRGMLENGLLLRQVIKYNIFSLSQDTVCLLTEIFASVQRQTLCEIWGEGFRLQPYYTHKKHTSCNKLAADLLLLPLVGQLSTACNKVIELNILVTSCFINLLSSCNSAVC